MMIERFGDVSFRGEPQTVLGPVLKVGDKAPEFALLANDLSIVRLSNSAGKIRLISVVPSLETTICDAQTRRFNEEAAAWGDQVEVLTVSVDLPLAQTRWCGTAGIENIQTLSDHWDMNFGDAYGTHIKELRQEQRAIFVVNGVDEITYVEYVPEIGQHPDYDAALNAVRKLL